jgi:F420-dependent methylenetetrahydromethanopterin dehydrogenase
VSQSHDLIATATLLSAEARQVVRQAKAKTRSGHAKSKRRQCGTPPED